MTLDVYWRIPMAGDRSSWRNDPKVRGDWSPTVPGSHNPGVRDDQPDGLSYVEYMIDTARAIELAGFVGALLPSFPMTDDPWIASAAIAPATKTFRPMIAFQPGFLDPVHAARLSASLQRLSGGRLVYNIITGGGGPQQLWWGDPTKHDDRYVRTTEFLDVVKGVWDGGPFEYHGRFYRVEHGGLPEPLAGQPHADLYFSGSSDAAIEAAGRHADYYLSWLEHPDDLRTKFDAIRAKTASLGRDAKLAVRAHVVARPTEEEAWEEVRIGWSRVDPEALRVAFDGQRGDSVGAQRQAAYTPKRLEKYQDLIIAPNIWGGISYLGDMPTIGIVGSYEQAAERLDDLVRIGTDAFILSGLPHLEEAHRIGEEVLPLFSGPAARSGPVDPRPRITEGALA